MPEARSPKVRSIIDAAGPDAYAALVVGMAAAADAARASLSGVRAENLVEGPLASPAAGEGLLAGLWLWHDALDEAHRIVQHSPGDRRIAADYAYWHAIVHRREGDFWNSKYWLDRCTDHPALPAIAAAAARSINARRHADPRLMKLTLGQWDPSAFVDLVEAVASTPDDPILPAVVELQRIEWHGLFDHSLAAAGGS